MTLLSRIAWAALPLSGLAYSSSVSVTVPRHPQHDRQVVDSSYQSLSIEFFAFMEYSGNATYSNPLNTNLAKHLHELGNAPLKVRIGGSSQTYVYWIPEQTQGLIGYYEDGIDKTYNVTLGPAFFDAFDAWPSDTEFVLGLPYPENGEGLLESYIEIARRAYEKLGTRLAGLEIGNERQDTGTPGEFTRNFLDAAYKISEEVFGDPYKKIYTAGTLIAPTLIQCKDPEDKETCWSVQSLFEHESTRRGSSSLPTRTRDQTRQYLLNHTSTAWFLNSHEDLAADSTARGIPYILGEGNSLFGHGRRNLSDTFSAALWTIDHTLYGAQTNITNIGFHQSWGWRYTGKKVEVILEEDLLSAYAIYDSGSGALSSVVALNLEDWNSTSVAERPEVIIRMDQLGRGCRGEVYRLTAPGADLKSPEVVSFAGQVDTERLGRNGRLTLKASEAALVTFDC
ncbi:hypothetical protein BJY04DRAFT_207083 [Aspergillus karnatakaensis]|uniref:glycosyl hydrolase family 79 C-terminal domain-containing protein n=1 Tax=Aspergillus karnatakaensis TaxID=1810916 RepID=UPI003CCD8E8C